MSRLPIVDLEPLRRYPAFRRLWLGLAISQVGSQSPVAVFYQVYVMTGSSLDVGLVSLAKLGPALVGALLGGSVADAVDRRKMLVVTQIAMALCSVGLAWNSLADKPALWPIFVLAAVGAGFAGADSPARTAIMMNLVPWELFATANVLRQLLLQILLVLGPALGGLVLARFGVTAVYWIDVASFASAIGASLALPGLLPEGEITKFGLRSIVEGFHYLRGRQAIQGCFVADLNAMILGMPTALFPAIALEHFHGGPQTVGYLYAAPGVGALVGMLLSGWTARVVRPGRAVVAAIVVWRGHRPVRAFAVAVGGARPAGRRRLGRRHLGRVSQYHPAGRVTRPAARPTLGHPGCRRAGGTPLGQRRGGGGRRACRRATLGGDRRTGLCGRHRGRGAPHAALRGIPP